MQHSSKCFKSVGLTEKFKENSCKLILYVINETFHSYVNIKCLGIFFPFSSFPLTELPLPDLHYMFVCFMGWWVGWHGGIFSWEEELIAESCDSFTEQTAVLSPIHPSSDVHPTPGEELPEGNCLPLPQLLKLSVHFLNENALSWAEPPHVQAKRRCGYEPPRPAPWWGAPSPSEGRGRWSVAATSQSARARFCRAHPLRSSAFATAVPVQSWGWMLVALIWV